MDHINTIRTQLKYLEVQLNYNSGPEKKAEIQAGLIAAAHDMDSAIAQLGVPLAKLPQTNEELQEIIKSVAEKRDPKNQGVPSAGKPAPSGTKPATKRKSSPEPNTGNRQRRGPDKDGFVVPPAT
ncbi:hypothetical protein CEXT_316611 [Caerostris extrusa]|uniref:Uncharacterized protein n=1 Tax=Caerostris extrusa TaxID=172846 RepID=A0AAV4RI92_CAEEX|nr:hypothetical protein CEXT_316611 [Caerostris extrusa]